MDETTFQLKFEANDKDKKYEIEGIQNSVVYIKELCGGYIPELYYLVLWKSYPKEKNIWKPVLTMQHLWKLINIFDKDYPKKLTMTSSLVNTTLSMAKLIIRLEAQVTK